MIVLIWIYIVALVGVFVYASYQFYLAILYRFGRKNSAVNSAQKKSFFPFVTIQLPIYNERYVVHRLLNCIAEMEYPEEKLQIQILDDSDDDTVEIIDRWLESYEGPLEFLLIRRKERSGYKAGALKEGLASAKGELIAIFDADFLPDSDFLIKTVGCFQDPKIGVVQTRWGFINREYSILTSLQTLALDAHFTLEQTARNQYHHFINFNGTGGVWRKQCILDGGNWSPETLTEDLDLSYRSQFKGWKFKYLEEIETPSELPVNIFALKKQQFRWNKGGAQNLRKHLFQILSNKRMRLSDRIHGILHLMNSSVYIFVLFALIASFPVAMITRENSELRDYFQFSWIFLGLNFLLMYVYWIGFSRTHKVNWKSFPLFLPKFFMFLFLSFGLTIHNTLAVLEGWMGIQSGFVRTPKFNIVEENEVWEENEYVKAEVGFIEILEFVFGIYFLIATYFDLVYGDVIMTIFHSAVALGFLIIWSFSIRLWWRLNQKKSKTLASIDKI
ncbi:MAG: glycosyltransferase [Crocinitomicaceae bacterium]|nr:glycosyltransferase [Crocinitomicaceae bacterium]